MLGRTTFLTTCRVCCSCIVNGAKKKKLVKHDGELMEVLSGMCLLCLRKLNSCAIEIFHYNEHTNVYAIYESQDLNSNSTSCCRVILFQMRAYSVNHVA